VRGPSPEGREPVTKALVVGCSYDMPPASCAPGGSRYRRAAMFEPAFITLAKIVATLVVPMSVIPLLFMFAKGGDTSEPTDIFDTD